MSNPEFRFKQFTVKHERCAMKVGTDGVLLGAWADVRGASRALDIGTGTGLIALMMAQRAPQCAIDGVDIDTDAVAQARENVTDSPWRERIAVWQADIRNMDCEVRYDAIVSNPPFFVENVQSPDGRRNAARHVSSLGFGELLDAVERMLTAEGTFSVVLPSDVYDDFVTLAAVRHLYVYRCTWVYTKPSATPKRVLVEFGREIRAWFADKLFIMDTPPSYSKEYQDLTRDFYLKF